VGENILGAAKPARAIAYFEVRAFALANPPVGPVDVKCVKVYLDSAQTDTLGIDVGVYADASGPVELISRASLARPGGGWAKGWVAAELDAPVRISPGVVRWVALVPRGGQLVIKATQATCLPAHHERSRAKVPAAQVELVSPFGSASTSDVCEPTIALTR
jgi:hypothetical protein